MLKLTKDQWKAYTEFTPTTAIYRRRSNQNYCFLGLLGEIQELHASMFGLVGGCHEKVLAELGDIAWYISELSSYYPHDLVEVFSIADSVYTHCYIPLRVYNAEKAVLLLYGEAAIVCQIRKREMRDDCIATSDAFTGFIGRSLALLAYIAEQHFGELSEVLERNKAKLLDRQNRNALHGKGDNR